MAGLAGVADGAAFDERFTVDGLGLDETAFKSV